MWPLTHVVPAALASRPQSCACALQHKHAASTISLPPCRDAVTRAMCVCPGDAVDFTPHQTAACTPVWLHPGSRACHVRTCNKGFIAQGMFPEAGPLLPCSEGVTRAMRMCPRNAFVPQAHADQAFVDAPIRLDDLDFNISAPHMHATCLEALQLQPGQR